MKILIHFIFILLLSFLFCIGDNNKIFFAIDSILTFVVPMYLIFIISEWREAVDKKAEKENKKINKNILK